MWSGHFPQGKTTAQIRTVEGGMSRYHQPCGLLRVSFSIAILKKRHKLTKRFCVSEANSFLGTDGHPNDLFLHSLLFFHVFPFCFCHCRQSRFFSCSVLVISGLLHPAFNMFALQTFSEQG